MQLLEPKTRHRFTAEQYMNLDILERTELLAGVIYDVSPRNEPHRHAVRILSETLVLGFQRRFTVQVQDAVAVPGWQGADAPEVDVAVLERKTFRPGPSSIDARAFIEVSDTTYDIDRKYKIPLYVSAGVPSWIVNIPLRQVEHYGSADDLRLKYGNVSTERETVEILGIAIHVADLFDELPKSEAHE